MCCNHAGSCTPHIIRRHALAVYAGADFARS
jgi:hypothetical protein